MDKLQERYNNTMVTKLYCKTAEKKRKQKATGYWQKFFLEKKEWKVWNFDGKSNEG